MRLVCTIWVMSVGLLCSCEKGAQRGMPGKNPEGIYEGTFQKRNALGEGAVSKIKISFSDGMFRGLQSSIPGYPILTNGKYLLTTNEDSIRLGSLFQYPETADWSLILEGDFRLESHENNLELQRESVDGGGQKYTSFYKLKRLGN